MFLVNGNMKASDCIQSWETIILTRQSEVDSFPINYPGCDIVDGYLIISGNNIVNIDSLIHIKKVNYRLAISDNPMLQNLHGLDSISFINEFEIDGNQSLLSLKGINNLESTNDFTVYDNDKLINMEGLSSLRYAKSLSIIGNKRIIDLEGLYSIHEIFNLFISGNSELINLNGLQTLSVLDNFHVSDNDKLINFKGFENITATNQHCIITGNPSLISFEGLNNWRVMTSGLLVVRDNASLVNLSGLNLETSGGFEVSYNAKLKNLEGLGQLRTMSTLISGNTIFIAHNSVLCNINDLNENLITNNLALFITDNPRLSCCHKVSSILDKTIGRRFLSIFINNNLQGCNDTSEIRTAINQTCCSTKYTFLKDTICQGESIVFDNQSLNTSGTYYDTIIGGNIDSIIVFQLTVHNKSYQIINKNLCVGQSFTLSNGNVITISGIYKDTIPNICDSIIEYHLSFLNNIVVNQRSLICEGQKYQLPDMKIVNTSGIYVDTVKSSFGCDSVVITNLSVFPNNFTVSLNSIDTIESGNSLELNPIYSGGVAASWNWTPATNLSCINCENPVASPVQTIQYLVDVKTQDGCEDTAQTKIVVRQTDVYVPQAFSPNNDGVNDLFEIFANNPKSFSMKIYNRWGELVFESIDVKNQWNGTSKGENCPVDSYSYILDVTLQNNKQYHKQNTILLLR